jgi:hypothetical protein
MSHAWVGWKWVGLWLLVFAAGAAAQEEPFDVKDHYDKLEVQIPMRDGVKLFTAIYTPKDKTREYPFLINRTCYSVGPYGADKIRGRLGPSTYADKEGYIIVHQDVRGRWMSEGKFDNMRPHVMGATPIDESSDTYDTIDWLLKNVPNNNGKAGIWGISYPGFYSAAALPEHHPALVAASPQAPISDFFFDDFHHNGAYLLSYFLVTPVFGYQHKGPTKTAWYQMVNPGTNDGYQFYMSLGPLSNASKYYGEDNFFWQEIASHPNYDEFWQARSLLPHLASPIKTNVLTVGGFFDAEDLYGPLHIYQQIEKHSPETFNAIVMGPWSHGAWSANTPVARVGKIVFGQRIADAYQRDIEAPFFAYFLKGQGKAPEFEAMMFDTGLKKWQAFAQWPPADVIPMRWYPAADRSLELKPQTDAAQAYSEFVSDPANPVTEQKPDDVKLQFTPRDYMSDDQRFATARDDVLTFQTEVLAQDVTLVGDIAARLVVATSESDADWVVKLIDVYPDDEPNDPNTPKGVTLAGFQQLVRGDIMRGRFRNSFEKPEPFTPNQMTEVKVPLQDILHTFKKGHRIMVQIQSTWFPLIDRCPQKYVPNIFEATADDFVKATHRVYHYPTDSASYIEVRQLRPSNR